MSSKRTILLIDYDPQSIQKTLTPLKRAGYRVEVAGDGLSGLEAFDKLRPDLVLIEPMVPKKHGFQVCQQIKSTVRGKRTPVLITTAFYKGRKHKLEAQQKYGCDGYLEKPIAEDLLLATCRQFLIDLPPQAPAPADASAPTLSPSVISFPDLPLGEERQPAPLAALDDLSDDEIQARLDRMLLDDVDEPVAPATEPPSAPREAASARPVPETPAPVPAFAPAAPAAPAAEKAEPEPPIAAALPPAEAPPARQPARSRPAVLDRPRTRTTEAAVARTHSRLPLWIGVAAIVCLVAGGALLWVVKGSGESTGAVASPPAEPRPTRTAEVPPALPEPEPEIAEAAEATGNVHAQPAPSLAPTSSRSPEPPVPAAPKPVDTEPRAPSNPPPPQAAAAAKPPAKPAPAPPPPPEVESPQEQTATAASGPAAESPEPSPAPSVAPETASESAVPATVLPREGDLIALEEVDVAPRATTRESPDYPRAARELRQEGTVVLRVLVSESGAVEQVEVTSGTNFRQLREEAVRAARAWRYEPALEQGVRVRVWVVEQVTFEL